MWPFVFPDFKSRYLYWNNFLSQTVEIYFIHILDRQTDRQGSSLHITPADETEREANHSTDGYMLYILNISTISISHVISLQW